MGAFDYTLALTGAKQRFITKHDSAIDWDKTVVKDGEETRPVKSLEDFELNRDNVELALKMGEEPSYILFHMPSEREKLEAFSLAGVDPTKDTDADLNHIVGLAEVTFNIGSFCVDICPDHPEMFPKDNGCSSSGVKREAVNPLVHSILTELGTYILSKMNAANPT